MKLKLAILCSDGPHHVFLVDLLRSHFEVVTVIQETGNAQRRKLARRGRWGDYFWLVYHSWRRKLLGLDRYRAEFFLGAPAALKRSRIVGTVVNDINGEEAQDLLRQDGHNLTVVMGTTVLKRCILAVAGEPTINIHGGFLPHYRGNHCFFFALYDGRTDRVGSTIHFIDEGIDSGRIVKRVCLDVEPNVHPEELYCRAEKAAVRELVTLLSAVEKGKPLVGHAQIGEGKTYRTRDRKPWHDLKMWIRRQQPRFNPWIFSHSNGCARRPRHAVFPPV